LLSPVNKKAAADHITTPYYGWAMMRAAQGFRYKAEMICADEVIGNY
jgi:hypothetical protein